MSSASPSSSFQPLDAITLAHLVREWSSGESALLGAKVNRIQQFSPVLFGFTFWHNGQTLRLCLSLGSRFSTLGLVESFQSLSDPDPAKARREQPGAFCMLLRKYLMGSTLFAVEVPVGERIVHFQFRQQNDLGDWLQPILTAELMGKTSNLILRLPATDQESSKILGVAHRVNETMSRHRELAPGLPYVAPPVREDRTVFSAQTVSRESFVTEWTTLPQACWKDTLCERYTGFGRALIQQSLGQLPEQPGELYDQLLQLTRLDNSGTSIQPAIRLDYHAFRLLDNPEDSALWKNYPTVSTMQTDWLTHHTQGLQLAQARQLLGRPLREQQHRLSRKQAALQPDYQSDWEETGLWNVRGNAILAMANQPEMDSHPEFPQMTLPQAEGEGTLRVALDPNKTWIENAQACFRQAKKARSRVEQHALQLAQVTAQTGYLQALASLLTQADTMEDLNALRTDWVQAGLLPNPAVAKVIKKTGKKFSKKGKPAKAVPQAEPMTGILQLTAGDGSRLWVGKSAQANERLSGSLGRGDDWWLHAQGMPGSHVLVKTQDKSPSLADTTLLEAAHLAAWFSDARGAVKVPVVIARHRNVRKIPNSYPGHVSYQDEQTVLIEMNPEILERVLTP